jgi:SAM-dependent methyltransferase
MTERAEHLSATMEAYDAIADEYAEVARDYLDPLPLDRAILAAFAECVRNASAGSGTGPGAGGPAGPVVGASARSVAGASAGPVAELGCGPGYVTAHLANLGLDIFGIDLSPAMIDIARKSYPDLRFEVGSMNALKIADASLQGVAAWYSIIHAPPHEVPGYLAEFSRVLAPGGHLVLGYFEADGGPIAPFDHRVARAYRWPTDELAALAGEAGFTEVGRMIREPHENENRKFRRGHLLMRREA